MEISHFSAKTATVPHRAVLRSSILRSIAFTATLSFALAGSHAMADFNSEFTPSTQTLSQAWAPAPSATPTPSLVPLYYVASNSSRYAKYAKKHPDKSNEQIMLEVNLHLDEKNYKNIVTSDDPSSLTVLVTKHFALPRSYKPDNLVGVDSRYAPSYVKLRSECCTAFTQMAQDMDKEGLRLYIHSGYRTNRKRGGANSLWYAWPGHSEHQTGLAFDLRKPDVIYETLGEYNYQKTAEYQWLCENAYRYGFILSFPKGKSDITGFGYEPWHWRYIGVDIATQMRTLGIQTYHEYWATYLAK